MDLHSVATQQSRTSRCRKWSVELSIIAGIGMSQDFTTQQGLVSFPAPNRGLGLGTRLRVGVLTFEPIASVRLSHDFCGFS